MSSIDGPKLKYLRVITRTNLEVAAESVGMTSRELNSIEAEEYDFSQSSDKSITRLAEYIQVLDLTRKRRNLPKYARVS